ncbi:hypothetical protein B0A64_18845 [Flavobacterium araucananum]|uniref:Uncharacterized protein n=1 Tax=Flavobacterium araucananum TaxID=946678 RepID=A0A227NX13_9FLAO|nr:hypothetical protein B0A64_18845 [Flavobacterium araucananum]
MFCENNPASGIEAVSFCEVKRSKRYSRKPDPEGDAQSIKISNYPQSCHFDARRNPRKKLDKEWKYWMLKSCKHVIQKI